MGMALILIKIDEPTKEAATKIFQNEGETLSGAIRRFLYSSIREKGFPFDLRKEQRLSNDEWIKESHNFSTTNESNKKTLEEINEKINHLKKETQNTSSIQIRIDPYVKQKATLIYMEIGIDLSTAIRVFLRKTVENGGYPMNLEEKRIVEKAISAIEEMGRISRENGNDKMTLEEINEEIRKARLGIK